ncbi:MAG: HlyD family efflux transporter periplasmic adaptor subunit [Chlorobiaceae bacterium]|nr:HlyD family efflux transporter periplasmic adaptor subunit [Chlorobiaceae bacterium]
MRQATFSGKIGFMLCLCILTLSGCQKNDRSDGYGNFEATEIIVSSEANGKLLLLNVEEGKRLAAGSVAAVVDTTQLHLTRSQLKAERRALASKRPGLGARIGVLIEERKNMMRDYDRYQRLVNEGAVPSKQLETIQNGISVIDKQIGSLETESPGITGEISAKEARIAQVNDQIRKSVVRNPVSGVVLTKYAEPGEVTAYGKPLYRIADLQTMYLRIYLSGEQIPRIRIGQDVEVLVDGYKPAGNALKGTVVWISSKAEFTPKIIQTREERVSMVYAVKVVVQNRDGFLKIGMPGEVRLLKKRSS